MELVASARLRRAQQRIEAMRPYADRMLELMAGTAQAAGAVRLPLLERRETISTVGIVPITGDRGLAGAFNAQVLRRVVRADARGAGGRAGGARSSPSGKKAQSTIRFRRLPLAQAWTGFSDKPSYTDAQAIAHAIAEAYVERGGRPGVLVYNAFVSPLVQRVTVVELLPVPTEALGRRRGGREPQATSARGRIRSTSSSSPSRGRSSSGCSRSTSRPSSTGRCSSRRPRASARR